MSKLTKVWNYNINLEKINYIKFDERLAIKHSFSYYLLVNIGKSLIQLCSDSFDPFQNPLFNSYKTLIFKNGNIYYINPEKVIGISDIEYGIELSEFWIYFENTDAINYYHSDKEILEGYHGELLI
jgi:hypothetical protein